MRNTSLLFAGLLLFAIFVPGLLSAQTRVEGKIVDRETDNPVPFAYVHLSEINRSTTADRGGIFQFQNIPDGIYTLSVHRIGFRDYSKKLELRSDTGSLELLIEMTSQSVEGEAITVIGDRSLTNGGNLEHASKKILGEELRRNLGTTLSETLQNEPGFSERSLGPAPGRPVIRGLGGERVLILQDGERMGDVSSQSADHAVTVDPKAAEEIEIARGPAALAYGSNAIGGVINVVRNQIPTSVPNSPTGSFSIQGKTVNSEGSASLDMIIPFNRIVMNLDLNGRSGLDYNTPDGSITNSGILNSHDSAGISYIGEKGYIGVGGSYYYSEYGIPPDPFGGHPNGVDIEMSKGQVDFRAERSLSSPLFKLIEARYSFVNYIHTEFESNGTIGTEFGNVTGHGSIRIQTNPWSIFTGGSFGVWGEHRDYAVFGSRTPDSNRYSGALFLIQYGDAGSLHYELGVRYDYVVNQPAEDRFSAIIGQIEDKNFTGLSSSAALIYGFDNGLYLGTTLMHSFRAPSLEELYSEGPHLAAYSYEIGNPNLDTERGLGAELFLRYRSQRFKAELAGYRNDFQNYLYARDTGEQSVADPSLNFFRFVGEEAIFNGFEFSGEATLTSSLVMGGSISYTHANRSVSEEEQQVTGFEDETRPLPMIPPIQGSLFARYSSGPFTATGRMIIKGEQDRLGEFETSTKGYSLLNASLQYRISTSSLLHTFTLSGENLLNQTYRNHLSRIKEVFPAPGRSINFLYRVYF
ncbi:MAG: TonB-dependent receptor [Bacteroidetes bacterium]|jgi:iron complex outermembrane receptor protein|nr:TonB-dependent receptor [Bacteroidota bacterium]